MKIGVIKDHVWVGRDFIRGISFKLFLREDFSKKDT